MRIALLSWESVHSIYIGGVAAHVTELACALERKGHEVHVFTRMGRNNHSMYELIHGVHYHRCPYPGHHDFIEEINNMCRSFVNSVFHTEDYMGTPFDIIHAHDWLAANAMVWIKQGRGRKCIFTIHSTEFGRNGNNFYEGQSKRVSHIEWNGTYAADRVIAVSKALKNEVMWIYSVPEWKTDAIYNGISYWNFDGAVDAGSIRARYGIGPMDPMVLFAGRMVYQKGPDILMEAIPMIKHYHPNAKFVFAGDGHMKEGVERRAHQLGVSHMCRFLGHRGGWELTDLFKACDCVCVPSRNEPFGIVILEAWSALKPVVATNVGGPSEIIWHDVTGFQVYPQPESVAWGVGSVFADFEHGRWMGRNGRTAVEKVFSWDVIADEVLSVYAS
jgi:glycosyltransferase involved in cell wall biosynthesis